MLYALFNNSSVAIWAMMIACILPVVFAGIAKYTGGFTREDNSNPREFLAHVSGISARADAVQKNSYESLPMFLVAVVTAMFCFVPQYSINILACLYILIRIGFGIAYLLNLALFRTILWTLSFACIMMLFWLSSKYF